MSWWVGKDRDAFNVALKEHTTRVMRKAPPVVPPPLSEPPAVVPEPLSVVVEDPAPAGKAVRRQRPRPTTPTVHAWRPGRRGRIPVGVRALLTTAKDVEAAILSSDEAAADAALGRAAIVMFVGFLFRQRLDWIVSWTKFQARECQRIAARLRRYHVWHPDGTIACRWLDIVFTKKAHPTTHDRFEFAVAFWLDALVAKGELTRAPADGDFVYGLVEWDRRDQERIAPARR